MTDYQYTRAVSSSYLEAPDDGDQIIFLYTQLMNLPFNKIDSIMQIERSLYKEYNVNPQDRLIIIALLQAQIMQGNFDKAKAFAYQLWDMGQQMNRAEKYLYLNSLLNIGLLEMAAGLLKPHFENLSEDIIKYYPMMLKFATMTGNVNLLDRLITHPNMPYNEDLYKKILQRYKNYNYSEHFKNIQRIILEQVKGKLCVYDYDIVGPVMEELQIYLYISSDKNEIEELNNSINTKLQEYYQKVGIERLSSFSLSLFPVFEHKAMGLD